MPSQTQKTEILYKKLIAGKSTVNRAGNENGTTPMYPAYQEAYNSKMSITAQQVWMQSTLLPNTTNPLNYGLPIGLQSLRSTPLDVLVTTDPNRPYLTCNGFNILQRLDLQMSLIPGSTTAYEYANAFGSTNWIADFGPTASFTGNNIVPFSFSPENSLYQYRLYETQGVGTDPTWGTTYTLQNEIAINSADDWVFDPDSLILNFFAETAGYGSTVWLRCYRYIGAVGFDSITSSGGGNSSGAWQNAAVNFIMGAGSSGDLGTAVTDGYDVFINTTFTYLAVTYTAGDVWQYISGTWTKLTVADGNRWIVQVNGLTGLTVISNISGDVLGSTTAAVNFVIEHWIGTSRDLGTNVGWLVQTPLSGWFVPLSINNLIYRYTGSSWVMSELDISYLTSLNKNMAANSTSTTEDGDLGCNTAIATLPAQNSYVIVSVNGVDVTLGNGWTGSSAANFDCLFATVLPAVTSHTGNTVNFATPHGLSATNSILLRDTGGVHVCTVLTVYTAYQIGIQAVNPSSAYVLTGSIDVAYLHKTYQNIAVGDKIVWFQSYSGWYLEAAGTYAADSISFEYIVVQ